MTRPRTTFTRRGPLAQSVRARIRSPRASSSPAHRAGEAGAGREGGRARVGQGVREGSEALAKGAGSAPAMLQTSRARGSSGGPEAGREGEDEGANLRLVALRRAGWAAGAGLVVKARVEKTEHARSAVHDRLRPWPRRASWHGAHNHHPGWAVGCRVGSPAKVSWQRPHRRVLGASPPETTTELVLVVSDMSLSAQSVPARSGRGR
jgi:hypothetical protein